MGVHNRKKQYGFGSVQPRDAEVVGKGLNKKFIINSLMAILIVALFAGTFAFFKSDLDTNLKNIASGVFKEVSEKDSKDSKESGEVIDIEAKDIKFTFNGDKNQAASIGVAGLNFGDTEKVKLAILASPDLFDYKNNKRTSCDELVFVEASIKRTPKVLNNTLSLLFNDGFDYGFPPANFISSTQKDLKFDHAVIENGVAKVFLTGKMSIEDTKCDSGRIVTQITETSKQFKTVKKVEIYLNSEKLEL